MVSRFLCSAEDGDRTCSTCSNSAPPVRSPKVYITGFGPFGNIEDNPSDALRKALVNSDGIAVPLEGSETLEVSQVGVDKYSKGNKVSENDIVIHLGVASSSDRILLESRAVNNMAFPIPDVHGRTPTGCILKDTDEFLYTSLPVAELACSMRDNGYKCDISYDAGKYLCNYLYFKSLARIKSRRVLFVHVPTFETMGKEQQMKALKLMLDRIGHLIQQNKL